MSVKPTRQPPSAAALHSINGLVSLACLLEVSAPKPGNVHRGADFEDVTFVDFVTSAVLLGESIQQWIELPLGQIVLRSVKRNLSAVGTNTNLGMVLLMTPLAKAIHADPQRQLTKDALAGVLENLVDQDGADVFEAIRLAKPGGLGDVGEFDVKHPSDAKGRRVQQEPGLQATSEGTNEATELQNAAASLPDLLKAMKLASHRDAVARQYVNDFADVFDVGVSFLKAGCRHFETLSDAIVFAHVAWMAASVDTLIVRKCGQQTAQHGQMLAGRAFGCLETSIDASGPLDREAVAAFWKATGELDFWLRSDGHRRNPGTTADLIAAALMVAIHNREISIGAD